MPAAASRVAPRPTATPTRNVVSGAAGRSTSCAASRARLSRVRMVWSVGAPSGDLQRLGQRVQPGFQVHVAPRGGASRWCQDDGMGRVTRNHSVLRLGPDGPQRRSDPVAVEEPLEIRVNGEPLMVTMRTPGRRHRPGARAAAQRGRDQRGAEDITLARYCAGSGPDGVNTYNVLDVSLAAGVAPPGGRRPPARWSPPAPAASAAAPASTRCCASPASRCRPSSACRPPWSGPARDRLREQQRVFAKTGGLHAAGLLGRDGGDALRPGGRRPAQRRRQGGRLGDPAAAAAAGRHGAGGLRAGVVRAHPEGGAGRHRHAGRGVRAQLAGRRPGRRGRVSPWSGSSAASR